MTETKSSKRRTPPTTNEPRRRRAEIKIHSGAPALFVDDRPCAPIVLEASAISDADHLKLAADKGLGLFRVQIDDLCWTAKGQLDSQSVDAALETIIGLPDTIRFILSIRVDAPIWWLESNPAERAEYARRRDIDSPQAITVSWASSRWLQSSADALERLLRYVLRSAVGNGLIGVQIMAGEQGAWIYPDAARLPDVGPCMNAAFIKYTVEKYRRNEGLLRKAWFDTRAEFPRIKCPTAIEREKAEFGLFRNPHRSRKLMDYYECLANEQSVAALTFCAVVKRVSGGALMAGLESAPLTPGLSTPECGHTFPDAILASPDVDFFVETGQEAAQCLYRPYRESAALHGKFVFAAGCSRGSLAQTTACRAAANGGGAIVSALGSQQAVFDLVNLASGWVKRLSGPGKSQTQIAVVMDPSAGMVISHRPDAAPIQTYILDQIAALRRAGIVFATYSVADLFHPQFPNHKVVLFPNCFYLSEPERRKLDARVKRSGQTAVWFWCPGIIGEDGINAEAGTKCCGQKLRVESTDISLRVRLVDSNDPLTWGRHAGDTFGIEAPASPRCTIADSKASRLGANSDNKTSFSVRRFDSWTSVVYGTLQVPLDLLQNLFRGAACHIYCTSLKDGDFVASDGKALCLTSRAGGAYTISLPGQLDVTDILSGKKTGTGVSEVGVTLAFGESAVLELKPRLRDNV